MKTFLKSADILLIVPPFTRVYIQSLAMHTLQGIAREQGMTVQVFYANLHFASLLGDDYANFEGMHGLLLGERIFARAAFGIEGAINRDFAEANPMLDTLRMSEVSSPLQNFFRALLPPLETLRRVEHLATAWVEDVGEVLSNYEYSLVGATTTFEQTNACLALLRAIKKRRPGVKTMIGGFNCEGEMAEGMRSHDPHAEFLDYVFSGESEESFAAFLQDFKRGALPGERIIQGRPFRDMDSLPELDYDEYFAQLYTFFPEFKESPEGLTLVSESSRGCSWGEKVACAFCGYRDLGYRHKSAERVQKDVDRLKRYPPRLLSMADLIIPRTYVQDLLPGLQGDPDPFEIYLEVRVHTTYAEMKELRRANVHFLQGGIESMSDSLLHQMRKGTLARQNVLWLRDAACAGINALWGIIWGFPGEKVSDYEEVVSFLPFLTHLHPPNNLIPLSMYRFSHYQSHPEKYGIRNMRPLSGYREVFPGHSDLSKAAYIFQADWEAETFERPQVIERLAEIMGLWNESWRVQALRPRLEIFERSPGNFSLIDTRKLPGTEIETPLTREQAVNILRADRYENTEHQNRAIENKAALLMKGHFVSLVTTSMEIREDLLGE